MHCFDCCEITKDLNATKGEADILGDDQPLSTHLHSSELREETFEGRDDLHIDYSQKSEQTNPHVE